LLDEYIQRLVGYQSQERKGASFPDDNNLIGLLQLIQELIKSDPASLNEEDQHGLVNEAM